MRRFKIRKELKCSNLAQYLFNRMVLTQLPPLKYLISIFSLEIVISWPRSDRRYCAWNIMQIRSTSRAMKPMTGQAPNTIKLPEITSPKPPKMTSTKLAPSGLRLLDGSSRNLIKLTRGTPLSNNQLFMAKISLYLYVHTNDFRLYISINC